MGLKAVKGRDEIRTEAQKHLMYKLSDMSLRFPIKSTCSYCKCVWSIPDLSLMERMYYQHHSWYVGFCCPECHKVSAVFKKIDLHTIYSVDCDTPEDYLEAERKFRKRFDELDSINENFKEAPVWLRIFRWMRHIDWKIANRKKPVYFNDKRFRAQIDKDISPVLSSEESRYIDELLSEEAKG